MHAHSRLFVSVAIAALVLGATTQDVEEFASARGQRHEGHNGSGPR